MVAFESAASRPAPLAARSAGKLDAAFLPFGERPVALLIYSLDAE